MLALFSGLLKNREARNKDYSLQAYKGTSHQKKFKYKH